MVWIADALTASRVLLAVVVASGSFPAATVVLVIAWLTDLLDGRLADTRSGFRHRFGGDGPFVES